MSSAIIGNPEEFDLVRDGTIDINHREFYDTASKEYLIRNRRGVWLPLCESQFKRHLRGQGMISKPLEGNNLSEIDYRLLELQNEFDINYAGPVAGYTSGFYESPTQRILVTESPRIINPSPGSFPQLDRFLDELLLDPGYDQRVYLDGWIKNAFESLTGQYRRPGQALVIAGPAACGKSVLQNLITEILGGRSGKPYQFMSGETSFNSDLFRAEHLMIEDEQASTDLRLRRTFGSHIKTITVNDTQRCHRKNREPIMLNPFWRLSITLNDEPENLMILPPIDESLEDKLMILHASPPRSPFPVDPQVFRSWRESISNELPAYLHHLVSRPIPVELESARFGVRHFHHPRILSAIDALSPERRLLALIDAQLFDGSSRYEWEGPARDLEKQLTAEDAPCRYEARKLLSWNTACGVYLGRLTRKHPGRIRSRIVQGETFYTITKI